MTDHLRRPIDPETQRIRVLTVMLGVFSFIASVVWAIFLTMARALSGMGDGSASVLVPSVRDNILAYSGSLHLFLIFLSCFWFVRGNVLKLIGILAHVVLVAFGFQICKECGIGGFLLFIPFAAFDAAWFWLFATKRGFELHC
jgi:hypothetical protein